MKVQWKDFLKSAENNNKKPIASSIRPKPIVRGKLHRTTPPAQGVEHNPIVKGELHFVSPQNMSVKNLQPTSSGLQRVGGSSGASTSEWNLNYKPPRPKFGTAHMCKDCGMEFPKADPKWSPGEKTSWRKEIIIDIIRHMKIHEYKKKNNVKVIPPEVMRGLWPVSKDEIAAFNIPVKI